jgi:hypothetical protein
VLLPGISLPATTRQHGYAAQKKEASHPTIVSHAKRNSKSPDAATNHRFSSLALGVRSASGTPLRRLAKRRQSYPDGRLPSRM